MAPKPLSYCNCSIGPQNLILMMKASTLFKLTQELGQPHKTQERSNVVLLL